MDRAPFSGPFSHAEIADQNCGHRKNGQREGESEDIANDVRCCSGTGLVFGTLDLFVIHVKQTIRLIPCSGWFANTVRNKRRPTALMPEWICN